MQHFKVHILNETGIERAKKMQAEFTELAEKLIREMGCEEGREYSLALTHLEKACFYAKKSMASNTANQAE